MFDTPAMVIGFTGAAFLIGSLAPVALESRERVAAATISTKGDRLTVPLDARSERPSTVSTIEVIGLSQAAVVFKDRHGRVLYHADPAAGVTIVDKNVDLPVVTVQEQPSAPPVPVVQQPQPSREGRESPAVEPRRTRQVGCEAPVSALARTDASRVPGLCLANLAVRQSS